MWRSGFLLSSRSCFEESVVHVEPYGLGERASLARSGDPVRMNWQMSQRVTQIRWCIPAALIVLAFGCKMGPRHLRDGRLAYNEALRASSSEELLLNLVRLRYLEPLEVLTVTSITTQLEVSVGVGVEAGQNRDAITGLGSADAGWSSRPTISFRPERGKRFAAGLLRPMPLDALASFAAASRRDISVLLRLFVRNLNMLSNEVWSIKPSFLKALDLLGRLQVTDQIEFGFLSERRSVSDPISGTRVNGTDLVRAAEAGYSFERVAESDDVVLTTQKQRAVIYFDPEAEEFHELYSLLQIDPARAAFYLTAGQEVSDRLADEILIETRSVLDAMNYLTLGIEVPKKHIDRGWARANWPAPGVNVGNFRDFFRLRYSEQRPKAQLRVQYRGGWYYVPDDDDRSRSVFATLAEAFSAVTQEAATEGPVLTLPLGGG